MRPHGSSGGSGGAVGASTPGGVSSPAGSHLRVLPALSLGAAASALLLFQLGYGGLTLTSLLLKLFVYVSFALVCFLLGSCGLLVMKSVPKIRRFDTATRRPPNLLDLFSTLMGRFSMPLLDSVQTRRVVVSHNVDKALKEDHSSFSSRCHGASDFTLMRSDVTLMLPPSPPDTSEAANTTFEANPSLISYLRHLCWVKFPIPLKPCYQR